MPDKYCCTMHAGQKGAAVGHYLVLGRAVPLACFKGSGWTHWGGSCARKSKFTLLISKGAGGPTGANFVLGRAGFPLLVSRGAGGLTGADFVLGGATLPREGLRPHALGLQVAQQQQGGQVAAVAVGRHVHIAPRAECGALVCQNQDAAELLRRQLLQPLPAYQLALHLQQ